MHVAPSADNICLSLDLERARKSPSAQRPSTPSTFKFELTLTRPRSFSHGTPSRIGFGDMPAVQTSVELTIFSPSLSSISFGGYNEINWIHHAQWNRSETTKSRERTKLRL